MKLVQFLGFWTVISVLFACESTIQEEEPSIFEIRDIGILATSEYTVGKVLKVKDEPEWYKFGNRNILISCKAKIKAGIDFSKLSDEDIEFKDKTVFITLPNPEIVSFDMDPSLIKTELVDVNGMRQNFTQEEKNEILNLGEKSIRKEIVATGILDDAKRNTNQFIKDFYKQLGYKDVQIVYKSAIIEELKSY
jgi:hypothetical protein